MNAPDRTPFNVRCGKCRHVWTAAYLPMAMATAATLLLNLHCPMCAENGENIFFAGDDE